MTSDDFCGHLFGYESPSPYFRIKSKKGKTYGICVYRAKTFMEMNEALEAIARRVHETCGGSTRGMDEWIDNQEACSLWMSRQGKCYNSGEAGPSPTVT